MKHFIKVAALSGLALSVIAVTTPKAQAYPGWPIAAGVVGGLAVGTAIGATVAHASAPPYYVYPAPTYAYAAPAPAPAYVAPPAPVVVAPPVYAGPVVYAAPYPYFRPVVRLGWGWGWHGPYRHYRRW